MPARQQAVVEVCYRQHDGPGDREYPVSNDPELLVCHGRANDEQQEPGSGGPCHAEVTVSGDTEPNGD